MRQPLTLLLLAAMLLTGCNSAIPQRDVQTLRWAERGAISQTDAETNSRIRLKLWDAFSTGRGKATALLPTTTIDGAALPRYLVVDSGTASLVTDYRRNRLEGRPEVDEQAITAIRPGYFERGRFIDSAEMPPPGRELILLLQSDDGSEVQF